MNKTSYEKEGLNSLNELFEKLIKCSEENDTKGTMRIVSSLTEEEKDYMYSWAKEQNNLAKVAGIVVEAEMAKKAFDIDCRFKKQVLEALPIQGYCLENDPSNPDSLGADCIKFTDNKYINGKIDLRNRKVYLEARDAENRKYEKTIDYSEVEDLMESINHFRKDIEETFEKPEVVEEVVKEEPFDILNDKEFMKQIGADWAVNLAKKAGTETYKDIGWTIEKNNDGYIVRNENGYIVHSPFNTEEEAEKYINEPVKPNYVKTDGYPIFDGRKKASIEGGLEKKADSNPKNAEELKKIYSNIYDGVNRMPALEIDDTNIIYFEPQGNQIVWGGITNAGLIPDYTFDYDYDLSFDSNIQNMIEQVIEQEKNK